MDLSLLVCLNGLLLGLINAGTPALCRAPDAALSGGLEDGPSLKEYQTVGPSGPLESSETTEPDSSGDAEMTPGEEGLQELMNSKTAAAEPEVTARFEAEVESTVYGAAPEGVSKADEARADPGEDARGDGEEGDYDSRDLLKLLYEDASTEYSDDYNRASEAGSKMDGEKVYSVKSYVPGESILILATPSGCSLMDHDGQESGLQLVEFNFRTSDLEDCGKLNEDILKEMVEGLAKDVAAHRGPATKMVEISVRDPLRNRELNIRETTQAFTSGPAEGAEPESEFADDLRSTFEDAVTEKDRQDASLMLSELLDFNFLPTNADSVYVMSYSLRDQEAEASREQLLRDFFSLLKAAPEEGEAKGGEAKEGEAAGSGRSATFESLFRRMGSFSSEKFEKALEEMKRLLETEEGKREVEKFSRELESQLEKTKQFVQREVETGKKILDDLSKHGVENVQCSRLSDAECAAYSKCQLMDVDGKKTCFVSPKTIYWLLETNCGLQSKSALLSIARDLNNVGFLSAKRLSNLEQSFDLGRICSSITHSYLAKLAPRVNQQPNNAFK